MYHCVLIGNVLFFFRYFVGFLKDVTGDYAASFYVLGLCMLLSGSVLLLEPVARRYERKPITDAEEDKDLSKKL